MSKAHKSIAWQNRRNKFFRDYQKVCAACTDENKTYSKITLHHLNRDHPIGQEPDSALIPLCMDHHNEVHEFASDMHPYASLEEATMIFIRMWAEDGDPLRRPRKRSFQKNSSRQKSRRNKKGGKSKYYRNRTEGMRSAGVRKKVVIR